MCEIENRTDNAILEIRNVTYTYEGERLPVWKSLSCTFYEGKIHAVIGPSGCGKSSILNLIDGLIPHMYEGKLEGEIRLRGQDITNMLPRYRCEKIGLVMQNPESQFCTFTVEEELAFGMENLGVSPDEMEDRICRTLRFVGMEGFENRDLNNLSGGQKQKIAIASILVTDPEILLLDEPTANLDPVSRKQVFDLIVRIARERKKTIIIVEHNINDIIEEVDRVLALDRDGKLILDCVRGTPEEIDFRRQNAQTPLPIKKMEERSAVKVVEIKNLSFAYPVSGKKRVKGEPILKGLNLDIFKQDFLAIVGENGVGKTTLMKLIFRICRPDEGNVRILGKGLEAWSIKDLYHQMGLVFQNPENQFITNTVMDEMMFSLKRVKIPLEEKKARAEDMLRRFHLEQEKEKSPFTLSQGQKRRLSVASMLLTNQQILFLDEPTYGQDYENRQELMKDMSRLVRKGITIVMITHDLSLVRQYATRVVEIEQGVVKKDMITEEFFSDQEV